MVLELCLSTFDFRLIGPNGHAFAPPLIILVASMVIFWIKKPTLESGVGCETNANQLWKNIGKGILLTGLAGSSTTLFFATSRFFLELDTTELFVMIAVIAEAIINLPPPILFIKSNPNLKSYVKGFLENYLVAPCFNLLIVIARIIPSRTHRVTDLPM